MSGRAFWLIALGAILSLATSGCGDDDDDNDDQTDQDGDGDSDTVKDSDADHGTDSDSVALGSVCADYDWDDAAYDYGPDYPEGPFGFKGSLCWEGEPDYLTGYEWGGGGDTIHDICLPNQDGKDVCLHDFIGEENDLLIVDISAVWCPTCKSLASAEYVFLDALKAAGWNPTLVTILEESDQPDTLATREDAQWWKETFEVSGDVLYDPDKTWLERLMLDKWPLERRVTDWVTWAFPVFFYVHQANMKVWDAMHGVDYTMEAALQQEVDILKYCSIQPGA